MNYNKTPGFTLVELVVVATILAILGAVGFSAYTGYIGGARDSNRIVELSNIRSGLQTYGINSSNGLPLPTESVSIEDGSEIIGYQGYASQKIIDAIDLKKGGTDPLDGTYYSYYLSENRSHFQLLGFLEEEDSRPTSGLFTKDVQAVDYSLRFPTVTGESLGIMVGSGNDKNIPIQELNQIVVIDNGVLDIGTTSVEYTAIIKDDYSVTGDNTKLGVIASLATTGGGMSKDCRLTLEGNSGTLGKDGNYFIQPVEGTVIEVYCDMTTDSGGWTQIKSTASGWMSDANKLILPDASELLFDYNSKFTGEYVDHQYKFSKFIAMGDGTTSGLDDGQEITGMTQAINIILGKLPNIGNYRGQHYGDTFRFQGKNVGKNYDLCHDDENISLSSYSMRSFDFNKNLFRMHGGTIEIWGGGSYADTNIFQTGYCGGYTTTSGFSGNRTDVYIR